MTALAGTIATAGLTLIAIGAGSASSDPWTRAPTLIGYAVVALALILFAVLLIPWPRSRAHESRGEAMTEAANFESTRVPTSEADGLQPEYLRGRIYPYIYATVGDPTSPAFAVRAALADRIEPAREPGIGTAEQLIFEDALENSTLESWFLEQTSTTRRPEHASFWRAVDPTASWIVTLRRPPTEMNISGWTLEGRSVLCLRPTVSIGPSGWLLLHADAWIRPLEGEHGHRPLSLEDLYGLVYVLVSVLLDDVGPRLLPLVSGEDHQLLAIGCVATPIATSFSSYVPLDWHGGRRAEGAHDVSAAEWYPPLLSEVVRAEERAETIRRWIGKLIRDSGYSGYEDAVARLERPRLAVPPKA